MQIEFNELKKIRELNPSKKIIFTSGVFDLLHVGHVVFFERGKALGDILVVMLGEDRVIKRLKGKDRPIIPLDARVKLVDSLKPVDYCFIDYISTVEDDLKFMDGVFENLRPDIYYFSEDTSQQERRNKTAYKYRVTPLALPRTIDEKYQPVSTSMIISKIKNLK